jgi:hypothetical protein
MLVVEILVLAIIAWECRVSARHRKRVRDAKKELRHLVERGQALLSNPPAGSADWPQWEHAALGLIEDAKRYLQRQSPEALASFLSEPDWEHADHIRRFHPVLDLQHLREELSNRVDNLHSIIESVDVYF